jgi:carbon-monoxide dehydrogenase small subunit
MDGSININHEQINIVFHGGSRLIDTLRENGYTEVKKGCLEGRCGTCAVLIDGKLFNSCKVYTAAVINKEILTVRGIGDIHSPHKIQKAFVEVGAVQCGYCTPGMILATYYLLNKNSNPSDDEIRQGLVGNICKCTGYESIIKAVKLAAKRMKKDE